MRNKKTKPKMQDLSTVPHFEVQDAVDKLRKREEKSRLMQKEMDRQLKLEHPTLAKALPYLKAIALIGGMILFFIALWIIYQVNVSYDNSVNPNLTQLILMGLK